MSDDLYPSQIRGLTHNVMRSPEFSTIVNESLARIEARVAQQANPIWHWVLTYNYLKDMFDDLPDPLTSTDLRYMLGFIMAHGGRFGNFLYEDPDDHHIGPALVGGVPNRGAEIRRILDVGSGVWYSPIQRMIAGTQSVIGFTEDIRVLNGSPVVYAGGSLTANYTIVGPGVTINGQYYAGMCLRWNAAPAATITLDADFYFRVQFEDDRHDFEKFLGNLLATRSPGYQVWGAGGNNSRQSGSSIRLMSADEA